MYFIIATQRGQYTERDTPKAHFVFVSWLFADITRLRIWTLCKELRGQLRLSALARSQENSSKTMLTGLHLNTTKNRGTQSGISTQLERKHICKPSARKRRKSDPCNARRSTSQKIPRLEKSIEDQHAKCPSVLSGTPSRTLTQPASGN